MDGAGTQTRQRTVRYQLSPSLQLRLPLGSAVVRPAPTLEGVKIRQLETSDGQKLTDFRNQLHLELISGRENFSFLTYPVRLPETQRWVSRFLGDAEERLAVSRVAEAGSEIKGIAYVSILSPKAGPTLSIHLLHEYRGIGLGKELMKGVIEDSSRLFRLVNLSVHTSNTRAKALYGKMGFEKIGPEFELFGTKFEKMVLLLRRPA